MSNNNHKISSCAFAEQIVSYLYDEFGKGEKAEFEAHLEHCSFCADEYAGFGFVRSSVLEWRNEDFSKLATPTFVFPAIENEKSPSALSIKPRFRFSDFGKMFSFNPALAMAAMAVLVVCGGIVFFALNFSAGTDISVVNKKEIKPVEASVSPTIEVSKLPVQQEENPESVEKPAPPIPETVTLPSPKERKKQTIPVNLVVNVPNSRANNTNTSNDSPKKLNDTIKKSPSVNNKQVPNLNDLDDDDDETIRLADLFEELDTK